MRRKTPWPDVTPCIGTSHTMSVRPVRPPYTCTTQTGTAERGRASCSAWNPRGCTTEATANVANRGRHILRTTESSLGRHRCRGHEGVCLLYTSDAADERSSVDL